jgi:hypothetical protein
MESHLFACQIKNNSFNLPKNNNANQVERYDVDEMFSIFLAQCLVANYYNVLHSYCF